ncbi:MAG: bifunctional isocitrate dehydrogenase kinase/phosphatase [Polyangiales bacterium]
MTLPEDIARTILDGFDKHYRIFRETSRQAKQRFEAADWASARVASRERIEMYDTRVREAVQSIVAKFPEAATRQDLWPKIKVAYVGLLYEHLQPELAETFYNSVACSVLDVQYYRNEYIFWRPAISTEHLVGEEPTYVCYYPHATDLGETLHQIVDSFRLDNPFEDLERDIAFCKRAIEEEFPRGWEKQPNFQVQILRSLFYRNKAAYLIGRALNGSAVFPFVVPILKNDAGELYLDTLLLSREDIGRLFSLARAYFMVDMEVPSAYVEFLKDLMPSKPKAELYTSLGLQKQGKTLFYRDLHQHLMHSTDRFVIAPGVKGMVMVVFTLPSFPYVFKVIRDSFAPPKDTDRAHVEERYQLVKQHDRVGRMADTLEYSHVAFPIERFDPALIAELQKLAPSCIELDEQRIVVKHMYVERRMIPLDIYLRGADESKLRHGIREYGNCVKELAGANIFPGDLFTKNFGVTRFGRVVFYDYDEISYLTDVNFREFPEPESDEDEMSSEPWYNVDPSDVFPQQFPTFLFPAGKPRQTFLELHGDLADPRTWSGFQERIKKGVQDDIFPYARSSRFCERFVGDGDCHGGREKR